MPEIHMKNKYVNCVPQYQQQIKTQKDEIIKLFNGDIKYII